MLIITLLVHFPKFLFALILPCSEIGLELSERLLFPTVIRIKSIKLTASQDYTIGIQH
jgi:hypothetical protein